MAFNYLSDEEFESDAEEHSHSATQQSKKRHVIHNYFVYSTTTKKSQCKKENCKTFINGKNTTNLKNHLKKPCHKTQYANYVKEVSDQRDVSSAKKSKVRESDQSTSTNQPTLLEINSKKALYAVNSKKQLRLRRRFSFFAGSTSFSSVLAENLDFKQYIRELDPRHVIPNRKCLRKDILAMAQKGKALIRNRIINALSKPLSTADIWTKKGLTSSYLGITVHYVSADETLEEAVIELISFPPPHTGDAIGELVKRTFQEWNLKVPIIVTDNGSNMVKAFKLDRCNHMEEIIESIVNEGNKESEDVRLYSDVDQNEDSYVEPDSDDDLNIDPDSDELSVAHQINIENEEVEYQEFEYQLTDSLRTIINPTSSSSPADDKQELSRKPCISHMLQLVMAIFDKVKSSSSSNSTATVPAFVRVISSAKKLVSKFNTSSKATPMLIAKCNKKLIADCSTRWSSNYLVFERLIQVRKYVNEVCEELGWDGLNNSDWAMLKSIVDLLAPFALYTQLVSGSKYITFSAAIPTIEELKLHLEACAEIVGLNLVSNAMLVDLKRRFDFITIPSSSHFDPTYLLSTILDPNYNLFVINDSVMRNTAIKNVLKIAKQMGVPFSSKPVSENEETDLAMAEERRTQEDGLPKNLFQTSFRRLYQKTVNANADMEGFNHDHAQERCTIQMELLDFINFSSNSDIASTSGSDHIHIDSILFWTKAEQKLRFPFLQRLALSLLAIPASSGASEREFSVAGWQTVGRKNRTTGEHLAAKVFLSCNKDLLRPLLF
ncbi:hypothetical protein GHT06_013674 [Daphnia sinensis]|uniref:HAT C-terminal dimerisation domain-containing protein n=1 Tax=Daphnia sinensis TaxID=1820382 RepID=A0AAD5KSB6_9CRUS|nr:hypothetical protein GHT06_013674 [Daphnia sinensis]